jgi:hypothetical protein
MGINGLLPFLKKQFDFPFPQVNIKKYKGATAGMKGKNYFNISLF